MKPVEIVLRSEGRGRGRLMENTNPTKIFSNTYANITMYSPVQLLYANKIINRKEIMVLEIYRKVS
jgi:hypothetical protein